MNLEPLLCEIRDRCLEATGEEPREVLANRGFKRQCFESIVDWQCEPLEPHEFWGEDFEYRGILIRCILPTDTTTLIVRT